MPILSRDRIVRIGEVMLEAGGALPGHASIVADHLAEANLAGHDSHGFIRIPQYLEGIREGKLDPKAEPEVVRERGGIILIDGHSTFGQVVATRAAEMAIEKAREHGISMATMGNLDHTGRIGTYPEMVARAGMAAIMFTGFAGGTFGNNVAPFGGRSRRLGTNPISMAFPHRDGAPVLLDFASSMAAEGKLRVYRNKGEELPDAWVLDKDGVPSRNPNDYYEGGAILPVGGTQGGHKGYALSVMIALFGGMLGHIASPSGETNTWTGSTIAVMDVGGMAAIDDIRSEVQAMMAYVKDTPLMEGATQVLFPGEIEAVTRADRLANGVYIDDTTWGQVEGLFDEYGVREELGGGE